MIFKSQQVNFDPLPWVNPNDGARRAHQVKWISGPDVFDPRPGFESTRDPHPWLGLSAGRMTRYSHNDDQDPRIEWAPRREQFDTPVNRVLVDARKIGWRDPKTLDEFFDTSWTPEEIEHARKVLTRLARA